MAGKGRKLTTSRSERYLGAYQGTHGTPLGGATELVEADVWSAGDATINGDYRPGSAAWASPASAGSNGYSYGNGNSGFSVYGSSRHNAAAGGLSLAFDGSSNTASQRIVHQCHHHHHHQSQDSVVEESPRGRRLGTSAPVNVPDWSKIYRVDSVESLHDSDDMMDELEVVPPHEYLARSRRMASNSVFEGVGRTLKGRDLSRVRDAVWSQTGFDG